MRLKESVEDGFDLFTLEGEIDLHYAPALRSLFQSKIQSRCPALVLDLGRVTFIDSSGLAAIIEYFRDAADHAGVLCLVGLNDSLKIIFEIVQLDKVVPIFPSKDDAATALHEGQIQPPSSEIFDRSVA